MKSKKTLDEIGWACSSSMRENPEHWHDLLEDAADALKEFLERGSKS